MFVEQRMVHFPRCRAVSRLLSTAAGCKFHIQEFKEEKILSVEDQAPLEMLI